MGNAAMTRLNVLLLVALLCATATAHTYRSSKKAKEKAEKKAAASDDEGTLRSDPTAGPPSQRHNFDDPEANHYAAGVEFDKAGDMDGARRAFEANAKFKDTHDAWLNLGVCLMRMNQLDEAEEMMLKSHAMAGDEQNRMNVEDNLDALSTHMGFRDNDPDYTTAKYRRRVGAAGGGGGGDEDLPLGEFSGGDDDEEEEDDDLPAGEFSM